jgi:hypothetical protein
MSPAQALRRGRGERPARGRAAVQIGPDEIGGPAGIPDAGHDALAAGFVAAGHDDVRPFGGEGHRDGLADVAGRSGDEGGLALE